MTKRPSPEPPDPSDPSGPWRSQLEQEREWFRVTLSSIGDAVITTDTEARITYLNPVAEKMTGWSNAEARGQPLANVFRIINELTRLEAKNPVARVLAEGNIIGLANHTSLIDRQGRETAIEDSAAPIRDAAGKMVGTVMVFHDVDARRKAERALARNEKLLADFFANAPVGLNWIGPDGRVLRANRAELEILGYREDEYVGRPWADFHVEPANATALFNVLKTGGAVEGSAGRLRAKDGSIREVLISANTFTENGHFVHARCFTRDVTEQNRAAAARAHLAALVASSDDAIVSKDLNGIIQSWNEGAHRLFGYTAAEAVGQPITIVIPPDRLEEEPAILDRLRHGERVDHFETIRRHKDGRLLDVSLTISPILNAAGEVIGASKIARDIGERRRTEQALRDEYAITEELNQVAQALATELDVARIVQVITDAGTRITRARYGAYFHNQANEAGAPTLPYASSGFERTQFEKFPLARAAALLGPTFRGEGVIRLDDVRRDPRFAGNAPSQGSPGGSDKVVSYLAVPVVGHSGEVLGGPFLRSSRTRRLHRPGREGNRRPGRAGRRGHVHCPVVRGREESPRVRRACERSQGPLHRGFEPRAAHAPHARDRPGVELARQSRPAARRQRRPRNCPAERSPRGALDRRSPRRDADRARQAQP